MNRTKLYSWIIILLIVLNISTVVSFIYHNRKDKKTEIVLETKDKKIAGKHICKELGFNESQMETFKNANRNFRPKTKNIIFALDSLKTEMFSELKKEHPDTNKLNLISQKIGEQHTNLKQSTVEYYMAIKKVCTPEQSEKLETFFMPLFENNFCNKNKKHCNSHNN